MKKYFILLFIFVLSNSVTVFSQYELTESAKTGQSIGNFIGKAIGYALLVGIIYLIYRAFTKKSEK